MSLLDMFRTPAPAIQQGQQVPPQPQGSPQTAANGVVPPATGTTNPPNPAEVKIEPAPLDTYKDLWQAPIVDPNKPDPNAPIFNFDPAKIQESASKMDFSKMMKPETLAKITAGGDGATEAFLQTMNDFGRGMTVQSLQLTTGIVEKALEKQKEQFQAQLPEMFKTFQTRNSLSEANPAFNNPALKPIVESLQAQMQLKHPNASSKEINGLVNGYMEQLGTVFSPKKEETGSNGSGKGQETDWSAFLS